MSGFGKFSHHPEKLGDRISSKTYALTKNKYDLEENHFSSKDLAFKGLVVLNPYVIPIP